MVTTTTQNGTKMYTSNQWSSQRSDVTCAKWHVPITSVPSHFSEYSFRATHTEHNIVIKANHEWLWTWASDLGTGATDREQGLLIQESGFNWCITLRYSNAHLDKFGILADQFRSTGEQMLNEVTFLNAESIASQFC